MENKNCIFCKIVSGELPSNKVYEDEDLLAFHDVHPAAPVHVLVIPKKHITSILDAEESDRALLGGIMLRMSEIAKKLGIAESGFRITNNTGEEGGQTVFHIHFHLLGGRSLKWPPG